MAVKKRATVEVKKYKCRECYHSTAVKDKFLSLQGEPILCSCKLSVHLKLLSAQSCDKIKVKML